MNQVIGYVATFQSDAPEWGRTSYIAPDTLAVFVPVFHAPEEVALLCAGHDGVPLVEADGHIYVEGEWMVREAEACGRNDAASVYRTIITRTRAAHAEQTEGAKT